MKDQKTATKTTLSNGKKRENVNCMFCNEVEDISHLQFYCKYAKKIWSEFFQIRVTTDFFLDMNVSITNVLFGKDIDYVCDIIDMSPHLF